MRLEKERHGFFFRGGDRVDRRKNIKERILDLFKLPIDLPNDHTTRPVMVTIETCPLNVFTKIEDLLLETNPFQIGIDWFNTDRLT